MLELKNISVDIKDEVTGNKQILQNISVTLPDNTFTAVTGPNGGGKSTLAKVIMGIIIPSEGQVLFNGEDITHLSIKERADLGISFGFQQPVRFKGLKVSDLISLASRTKIDREALCVHLTEVGLCAADYIDRPIDDSLSGGEMKRIEIASILARDSKLSIFDEPEAGVDIWSFQNLINIFKRLQEERGESILIISHQEKILSIADTILIVADGKIVNSGTSEEMMPILLATDPACDFCPHYGDLTECQEVH